jgi:hypothetical protein
MNSATSTERAPFRPWHFFVVCSLAAATVAVLLTPRATLEHLLLMSLAVAAAGGVGVALYRTIHPLASADAEVTGETLGARARQALEREKQLVLRSIKELEFDRAMGKVGESDFEDMVARLRSRAMGLMRQLDQEGLGYRSIIEQELERRLGARPGSVAPVPTPKVPMTEDAESPALEETSAATDVCPGCGAPVAAEGAFCASCGTRLRCQSCGSSCDPDARFCKWCGAKLENAAVAG